MRSTSLKQAEIDALDRCVWWAEQAIRGIVSDGDMPSAARAESQRLAHAKNAIRKLKMENDGAPNADGKSL